MPITTAVKSNDGVGAAFTSSHMTAEAGWHAAIFMLWPAAAQSHAPACPELAGADMQRLKVCSGFDRSGHVLDFSPSRDRRRAALSLRHSFPSNVARDRPELRRGAVGQIEPDLLDVAPAPAFRRVIAFDDRMPGRVKMLGGM